MGIALLSFVDFLVPLHSLASRWMPSRRRRSSSGLRYVGVRPSCGTSAPARPLRVVRLVDAQQPDKNAGRVMISGRMADVCAELDRMVALESAATLSKAPGRLH